MQATLQEAFIESQGNPVQIGTHLVQQMDKIPITKGVVRCRLISPLNGKHGIVLKAPKGKIFLSDGTTSETVHIWNEMGLTSVIEHPIESAQGELRIWNVYRVQHQDGKITEDSWTGNAGMVVTELGKSRRRYACSDGTGNFNPSDFEFEVDW